METITPNPDHEIEKFWLAFKQSMLNFYSAKHVMSRPIDQWSAKLNRLQTQQKYTEIEAHIKNYLSLYGLDVLRTESQYYINILITNLKRWDKIAGSYKFFAGEDGEINIEDLKQTVLQIEQTTKEAGTFDEKTEKSVAELKAKISKVEISLDVKKFVQDVNNHNQQKEEHHE